MNIAGIYAKGGMLDEALEFYEGALEIYKKVFAAVENHPSVANAYNSLASALIKKGDTETAFENYSIALNMRLKSLGAEHPATLASRNNIAYVHSVRGEHRKALQMHLEILASKVANSGEESLDAATSYNNIGICHYRLGGFDEALAWLLKSLIIHKNTFGEGSYETINVEGNLRFAYDEVQKKAPGKYPLSFEEWEREVLSR